MGGKLSNMNIKMNLKNLENLCYVSHCRKTPYHSHGNGQVEPFNRAILDMLQTLSEKEKSRWKNHVNQVVHAYNCTHSDTTAFPPIFSAVQTASLFTLRPNL